MTSPWKVAVVSFVAAYALALVGIAIAAHRAAIYIGRHT